MWCVARVTCLVHIKVAGELMLWNLYGIVTIVGDNTPTEHNIEVDH